jgi:hypothetical protein
MLGRESEGRRTNGGCKEQLLRLQSGPDYCRLRVSSDGNVSRRDRLGGWIHEYYTGKQHDAR